MPVTDDDKKTPIEHTLDVFVYLPLGFVLDFPQSIPRYIDRGRRELSPSRLLSRGGPGSAPGLFDARERLSRLHAHTQSTLRALGVGTDASDPTTASGNGRAAVNGHRPPASPGPTATPAAPTQGAASPASGAAEVPPAPAEPAPDPSTLAITDYDSLSASQVVPRLDSLATDELEGIRAYESATRGRKTILNKIAQIQSV